VPSRFDLVIFDSDGVLVDSEPLAAAVLAQQLTELGWPLTPADAEREFKGGTIAGVRAAAEQRLGGALDDGFEAGYYGRLFELFETRLRPVDGIAAVLDALERTGTPACVASNGPRAKIERALAATGLRERFDGRMFSSQDVAQGKPAPDLFLHAAAASNVDPARCAVVEDSSPGVRGARAAGMTVFAYAAATPADELADADAVFGAMTELPGLLGIAR